MAFIADKQITPERFAELAKERDAKPRPARKVGCIAAMRLEQRREVQTWSDGLETVRSVEPGDWLATNLDRSGEPICDTAGRPNQYVIKPDVFEATYAPAVPEREVDGFGRVYAKQSEVAVLPLPEGFDILAPWGARQTAPSGYLVLSDGEVYGVEGRAFEDTYEFLDG